MGTVTDDEPPGDGWQCWLDIWGFRPFNESPTAALMQGKCVEVWRKGWGNETSFFGQQEFQELHPATNVAGLWWRPA